MAEEKKQMTEEEMKEYTEKRKKEWEEFYEDLKSNPDEPVTKGDLKKAVDFLFEDFAALSQMVQINSHNTNVLNQNFNQIVSVLQGGKPGMPGGQRTKGGIVLP